MTRVALFCLAVALAASCGSSRHATACSLKGSIGLQGATGNLLGGFTVENTGGRACRLGGFPRLELFRSDRKRVALTVHRGDAAFPSSRLVTLLRPGRSATAWVKWTDYCGSLWNRTFTFRLTLPTGQRISARTAAAEKCQETGGAPRAGPGTAELSISGFH